MGALRSSQEEGVNVTIGGRVRVSCGIRSKRVASAHEENKPSSRLPDKVPVEEFLVRRAQKGDRDAFARLIETYWDSLHRWMYRLTRHRQTAEDLTQETFLKAYARLQSFKAGTNFHAWVFRIGFNTFANHRRDNARTRETLPEQVESKSDGPVEQAIDRESLRLLETAVNRLPDEFRLAFLLRVQEGLSFREIAPVLDLTEETARWRVFKARQMLLQALAPELEREKS
jgi:RNA polymerase sigma-70 factor, ECF subfamily